MVCTNCNTLNSASYTRCVSCGKDFTKPDKIVPLHFGNSKKKTRYMYFKMIKTYTLSTLDYNRANENKAIILINSDIKNLYFESERSTHEVIDKLCSDTVYVIAIPARDQIFKISCDGYFNKSIKLINLNPDQIFYCKISNVNHNYVIVEAKKRNFFAIIFDKLKTYFL